MTRKRKVLYCILLKTYQFLLLFLNCRSLESDLERTKKDYISYQKEAAVVLDEKNDEACEQAKLIKALENEKAVLSAAIEARDGKLAQKSALLDELKDLRQKAQNGERAQSELESLKQNYIVLKDEMKQMRENAQKLENSLGEANRKIVTLEKDYINEKKASTEAMSETNKIKLQFQKVRGERNTFKQKADSLAKELAKICRNGREINDIEKVILDNQLLNEEVVTLRSDKKRAMIELEQCKSDYEQYIRAQIQAATDDESVRICLRNLELEKIITGMTEYLDAKQMQLESVQEANRGLTEELRLMAEKTRDQNDI